MVGIEEGSFECKQIVNLTNLLKQKSSTVAFSSAWFLHFFNYHFLLFVLTSAVANCKTATEAKVLNKIARAIKYVPDKIGAGSRGKTWMRLNILNLLNQCASGKTRRFGPPLPYATIVCRRFEPPFNLK